jgi:hypothetical protein
MGDTWSLTLREHDKQRVFENRALSRIASERTVEKTA